MTLLKSSWEDRGPDTLVDICTRYCTRHLDTFCVVNPVTKCFDLMENVALPTEICEKLLHSFQNIYVHVDDFVSLFQNVELTRLKRVNMKDCDITDDGLKILLDHKLVELVLSECPNITDASIEHLNNGGRSLLSLIVGPLVTIFPDSLNKKDTSMDIDDLSLDEQCNKSVYRERGYILKLPNLRRFIVRDLVVHGEKDYFELVFSSLKNLTHLDLSSCGGLGDLSYLRNLSQLVYLVLYNVQRLQDVIEAICNLKNVRHLDISQISEKYGTFRNPNQTLTTIVESLPNLTSLDISGTNLDGRGVAESNQTKLSKDSMETDLPAALTDIPGLSSRVANPLEFLGLYNTMHDGCHRYHLPAKKVSGDANEKQILTAAQVYIERAEVLQKVLNDLFHIFRYETCHNSRLALDVILQAMNTHLFEKHIQISGSASLFYIVKGEEKNNLHVKVKQKIISTLLNGMNAHKDDSTMMRNGCLTLCHFKIPQDVLFDYKRLVIILLHIVSEAEQEDFVQRIGIYLLNSLACQVDGVQKQLVGDLGAIAKMLSLIEVRLSRKLCDDVMEIAWSTMWNVTDETGVNCQRFLDGRGMYFFLRCLQTFPDKAELLRNMMGLLGNVAEVEELRPKLMTPEFVSVFADLLDSKSDGIEVSYNAAGVLSHMASDAPCTWTVTTPPRDDVLRRMVTAIERWDLSTTRNINYRSFEPILRLIKIDHTPECQYWAVWALANLTKVYPKKYCHLIEEEGGVILLEELLKKDLSYPKIRELALSVQQHCQQYSEKGTVENDDVLEG